MKKIVALILLVCMALSLAACADNGTQTPKDTTPENTTPEITMQEIYDANLPDNLFKHYNSITIRDEIDGVLYSEKHLTKEYVYHYIPGADEASDWAEFTTEDAVYTYMSGGYVRYLPITPDGLSDGFAGAFAEKYASTVLSEDLLTDTIESVSQKDGRITVKSVADKEAMAELGVASAKSEFTLDAKTYELISLKSDFTYEDGSAFGAVTTAAYDAEAPEKIDAFLKYANQTDNLRSITVVSNPGTEQEESKSIQAPKGLIIGFEYVEDSTYHFEVYTDAACTEDYDPYGDTDSDITVYIKWTEQEQTEEQ